MLKILGLIFLFIYVIRPLLKFLFKGYIVTQVHKYQSENMFREKERAKKEGTIDVDYVPPKKKTNNSSKPSNDGDYVPYEEIK
ncbi:hypothetical protein V7S76_00785 [Aquirufa sp. ROCK2-A2]